jgi:hypothetical protein
MIPHSRPIGAITQLLQSGLIDDITKLPYGRQVMIDPRSGFYNPIYREYAVDIMNKLLDIVLNDGQTYNRVRQLLLQDHRKYEENLNNEEKSVVKTIKKISKELNG